MTQPIWHLFIPPAMVAATVGGSALAAVMSTRERKARPMPRIRIPRIRIPVPVVLQAALVAALAAIALAAATAPEAQAGEGHWKAHRVGLADATVPPTVLHYLAPHRSITYTHGRDGHNCPRRGFFSDVQAYAWNGTAIGAQVRYDDYDAWSVRSAGHGAHGRVTFDGITFWNGSNVPVLVAGWCE